MINVPKKYNIFFLTLCFMFLTACSSNESQEETLVALGDSIPFGAMLEPSNNSASSLAYPDLIGQEVGANVENLSVSGWTTHQLKDALETDENFRKTIKQADYVSMSIGGNDLLAILGAAQRDSGGNLHVFQELVTQKLNDSPIYDNITDIIEEIQLYTDAPIVLFNVYNPFQATEPLHLIGEALLPEINASFQELADSFNQVHLADAYTAYNKRQEQYVIANDIHPTHEGQAVLAAIGIEALGLE